MALPPKRINTNNHIMRIIKMCVQSTDYKGIALINICQLSGCEWPYHPNVCQYEQPHYPDNKNVCTDYKGIALINICVS